MRIIAGKWRGLVIERPLSVKVRPMGEKVRGALFDILGPVNSWVVLDAYAGSGAVGLEALSRGAAKVEAIEVSRSVARVITLNASRLQAGENYQLSTIAIEDWLKSRPQEPHYDLIVAGPPFAKVEVAVLSQLGRLLKPQGLLVFSHSGRMKPPTLDGMKLKDARRYGDEALSFYGQST